jgi:hypothetical protein
MNNKVRRTTLKKTFKKSEDRSLYGDEVNDLSKGNGKEKITKRTFRRVPRNIKGLVEARLEQPGKKRGLEIGAEEDVEENKKARTFSGDENEELTIFKAGLVDQSYGKNEDYKLELSGTGERPGSLWAFGCPEARGPRYPLFVRNKA